MNRVRVILLLLLLVSPALAADTAPSSDPYAPYIDAAVLVLGMVVYLLRAAKEQRMQALVRLVPDAHDLAQRAIDLARAQGRDVDAAQVYLGKLDELARGLGYDVREKERVALAALGSAEHQRFKRAAPAAAGVDPAAPGADDKSLV